MAEQPLQVIVLGNVVSTTRQDLEYFKEHSMEDASEVKVCVGKDPNGTIFVIYGPVSVIHEDLLKKGLPFGDSRGGDTLHIYAKEDAIAVELANRPSFSIGVLRSEFRATVVAEFKKLITQLNKS